MLWPKKKSHFSYNYDTRSPVLLTLSNTAVAYTAARDGAYRTRESSPGLLARCYHLYYVGVCAELCWRTACISNVQLHNAYKALLLTDPDFCSWRTAVTSLLCCACVLQQERICTRKRFGQSKRSFYRLWACGITESAGSLRQKPWSC